MVWLAKTTASRFSSLTRLFSSSAGATLPILGFGNSLANGAITAVKTDGLFGALSGGLIAASAGVAVSIGLSYLVSFFVSSKTKKD